MSDAELKTDDDIMNRIDDILYGVHPSPYSKGDALLMLVRARERIAYQKGLKDTKQTNPLTEGGKS